MSDNPFVIKVPEGATEVDLGPILRPLVFALKGELSINNGRPHSWASSKNIRHSGPEDLDDIMRWVISAHIYEERIRMVTRPILLAFLADKGWVDEDGRGCSYIRDYEMKKSSWDRNGGDTIRLRGLGAALTLSTAHEIVSKLAYEDCKTKLEKVDEVLSYGSILDRIAHETSD
jgi:hypothetical protein